MPYKNAGHSITSDNGCEFAEHKAISKKLNTDFDTLTTKQITEIQHKINRRPREKLNFETPKNQFYILVA